MSKGGGQQTSTQQIDPQMKAAFLANLDQAKNTASNLQAQPIAGFTDTYNQGASQASQVATGNNPGWGSLNYAATAAQNPATYQPMQVQGAQLGVGNVAGNTQSLMDPYINNQIQSALALSNQNEALQHQQNAGGATAAGAFGGTRQAVQDALTSGQYALANNNMIAGMENQGYQNAQNAALSIGQSNTANQQQANLANQNAGLQGAMVNNMGAATLGSLGSQQLGQGYNAASVLQNLGLNQQNLQQQQLNAQYNLPFVQQQLTNSALSLQPANLGGSTSQPYYTNPAAGALGGAAAGAAVGSAVPGIGTAIGAGVGGLIGLLGGR